MYNAELEGREVIVKPREGVFTLNQDGALVIELGSARELAQTLGHASSWTVEELSDEDPE